MKNPEVNIPLLRKAVEWAEAEAVKGTDGRWNQQDYVTKTECGTACCIAGWVAVDYLGHRPDWWHGGEAAATTGSVTTGVDGDTQNVADVAEDALGLTERQACSLFGDLNNIADVRRIAEEIAGERL